MNKTLKYDLLGLVTILIWATTGAFLKQIMIYSNNNYFTVIVAYNTIAFLTLSLIIIAKREYKLLQNKKILKKLIPLILLNGLYDVFVGIAYALAIRLQYPLIGNYMWPMLIVLFLGIKQKSVSKNALVSTLIGFIALLILVVPELIGSNIEPFDIYAIGLALLAAVFWALYSVLLSEEKDLEPYPFIIQALSQGVSAIAMFIVAVSFGKFNLYDVSSTESILSILIFSLICMNLAYVIWAVVMLKHPNLQKFSVMSYITPVLSIVIASFWFKGTINFYIVIALVVLLFGIYLSKRK